jgi:class 3 adenylate cyclase/alpha-beta hydrolase superfamily lysophospholipase
MRAMEREVRYCTSEDGTRIAYCVEGEGPPLVICNAGWESFASEGYQGEVYRLAWRGHTTVRYDMRGVGLSEREAPAYELDRMTADLEAVVRASGLDRFALWASSFSVAPAILFAVRHPEQVARLVLMRVITRGADVMPQENLDALVQLIRSNWEMATQMLGDLGIRHTPEAGVEYARLTRENTEPEVAAQMLTDLYATTNVHGLLKDVACPTLIAHRREDTLFPFAAAQHAAAVIPQARLLALSGSGQVSVGPDAEGNVRAMAAFLDEDPETRAIAVTETPSATDATFRAVLFTDLVGHTAMMTRLGDERGREVLREHEKITRDVLAANSGTEVKTMGDGFMASFGSVTKSVECAIALQRAFAEREGEPLNVRVGLNAGEPIEEDGDLFGATVILAARIAAKADGGEILVADTVRGLCSGKGFLFADRGDFVAKGFEEPVKVYEVSWREA